MRETAYRGERDDVELWQRASMIIRGGRLIRSPRSSQPTPNSVGWVTDTPAAVGHADRRARLPRRGKPEAGLPHAKGDWFP
jgi:hypothetical protein